MPKGNKNRYSAKQKRQASHIKLSCQKRGAPKKRAAQIAWATVNKQTKGADNKP